MQRIIINAIIDFYQDIQAILHKKEAYFYVENHDTYIEIKTLEDIKKAFSIDYRGFYITSKPLDLALHKNFYADDFFDFVIDGSGGKFNEKELEAICLRVVSKKPDKKVKTIFTAIIACLKINEAYKKGIKPMSSSFHRNTFYKTDSIKNKILWHDFDIKKDPIEIYRDYE